MVGRLMRADRRQSPSSSFPEEVVKKAEGWNVFTFSSMPVSDVNEVAAPW
jgi:hypothetical protein